MKTVRLVALCSALVCSFLFSSCGSSSPSETMTVTSGSGQSVQVGSGFAAFVITVTKGSAGVSGATVTFTAPTSGASCAFPGGANATSATTNSSGIATSAICTANHKSGAYTVTAAVSGVSGTATFSLTNLAGAANSIAATSGTPQSAIISTAFTNPLVATVTDQYGNGVSGETVTFTAPSSGASGTFAGGVNTATTNSSGVATSAVFTANSTQGSYTVSASDTHVTGTASFSLTNNLPPVISVQSGSGQSATVNTAFAAQLVAYVTQNGSALQGAVVTFTPPTTGASGTFAGGVNTATTNAQGLATSAVFTANTKAGAYAVTASTPGATASASFTLTNNAGPAAAISPTSGSGQSATVGTAFTNPLVATVSDQYGNPVSGVTVTFTPPSSGASGTFAGGVNTATTNSSGVATSQTFTANTTAGSYSVTASTAGTNATATFTLTNNAGPAASISAYSGSGQTTPVGTAFPNPLVAKVLDQYSNPVSGATVTFTPPAQSGPSGTFAGGVNTATTNSSGLATSAVFTANNNAGSYTVSAAVQGVTPTASFSLTNSPPAPVITVSSGSGQQATVGTAFANPLVALVMQGGSPLSGATVTFTAPSSGASGTFANGTAIDTETTNASGLATSTTFTANSTAGSYTVAATTPGATSPANFSLTNNPSGSCANNSNLNGNYAFLLQGWVQHSGTYYTESIAGSFKANGAGNVSSGQYDSNDAGGPHQGSLTATYCIASNNLGTITITPQDQSSTTYALVVQSNGNGSVVSYDATNPLIVSGIFLKQNTSAFSTGSFVGQYSFGLIGADASYNRMGLAGSFTANGTPSLTGGEWDQNDNGTPTNTSFGSNDFNVTTSGRGTVTLTASSGATPSFAFYVVNASQLLMIETDTGSSILTGQVIQQSGLTGTNSDLDGVSVYQAQGLDTDCSPGCPDAQAGLVSTDGNGNVTSFSGDENDGGTLSSFTTSGTYSVSSNGRVTTTLTGVNHPPILYLIAKNAAFATDAGSRKVNSGLLQAQSGSNFGLSSLSGTLYGGTGQPVTSNVCASVDVLTLNSGNGGDTQDDICGSGPGTGTASFTYTVSTDGRGVATTTSGGGGAGSTTIFYIITPTSGGTGGSMVTVPGTGQGSNPALESFQQ